MSLELRGFSCGKFGGNTPEIDATEIESVGGRTPCQGGRNVFATKDGSQNAFPGTSARLEDLDSGGITISTSAVVAKRRRRAQARRYIDESVLVFIADFREAQVSRRGGRKARDEDAASSRNAGTDGTEKVVVADRILKDALSSSGITRVFGTDIVVVADLVND